MNPKISIISPVYMAEGIVEELVKQIVASVSTITDDYEVVLVCDGSEDNSWERIVACCSSDERIKGVKLSRNFGQEYAIYAGLKVAKGDWMVVMDCDLQDDPAMIPQFWKKAQEGFDVVFGKRVARNDSLWRRWSSKLYYKVFNYLTETQQDDFVGNFGMYSKKTIDAVLEMGDKVRCFTTMVYWTGLKRGFVDVKHEERYEGRSSYSLRKLLRVSRETIFSFSTKPLRLMVRLGLLISSISFLIGLFYIVQWCRGIVDVSGYTSLIVSLWFIAGLLISFMGVLGIYLGEVLDVAKQRPLVVVEKVLNLDK